MRKTLRNGLMAGAACLLMVGPAAAQGTLPAPVEQTALAKDALSTGTLTRGEGAMPADLWRGADHGRLGWLLAQAPDRLPGPALGEAMRRVLLSPGEATGETPPALGARKLQALANIGFTDEVRTIASLSSASASDPLVARALATADLLDGQPDAACRRNAGLSSGRDEDFWVKLRVLCYAMAGERDAADLTLALLREKGALGDAESVFLTGLATGAAPKTPPAPGGALDLAAARQLGLPLAPALLESASAGVLKAIARDGTLDAATRIAAGNRAAAMGVLGAGDLVSLYESIDVEVAELARASDIARERPADPMSDVILFQSVRQMTAPEFLRDKAGRIAEAISAADSFARSYALGLLYADEIEALEGALLTPREAGRFAAARMAIGDSDGAARWLFAMIGSGGLSSLDEVDAMEMIELANHLAVLDPISAKAVGEAAGIALAPPASGLHAAGHAADGTVRARIVESAFDAAVLDIPGQAALAALALSVAGDPDDPVAGVVIDQSLRAAGLNDLRRRIGFEAAWRARFAAQGGSTRGAAAASPGARAASADDGGLTPRVKPPTGQ